MNASDNVSSSLFNTTRGIVLADSPRVARTCSERRRGLLGQCGMAEGGALIIVRCRQVHSIGMRFPFDVVFIDGRGQVTRTVTRMVPGRITRIAWRARLAVELPAGTVQRTGTRKGDIVAMLG